MVINLGVLSKSGTTGYNKPYFEDRYQWVYPNPFDNILYFQQGSIVKHTLISNLSGQVVINTPIFEEAKLNTGHLKSGVYLVKLVLNNNETKVFKMIMN